MVFALLFLSSLSFAEAQYCHPFPPPAPSNVEEFLGEIHKVAQCAPLRSVGDARVHNTLAASNRANDTRYTLRRLDNNVFEAAFNLEIAQGAGTTTTKEAMLARVKGCLQNIPPIRGPGGQSIILRAYSDPEAKKQFAEAAPPKLGITITPSNGRGSATEFRDDFTCGHITHELMHHAGLCDEYHESGFGIDEGDRNDGWCRPIGPGDSLMSQGMLTAYDDAAGAIKRCDMSSDPEMLRWSQTATPDQLRAAARRSFRQIGNFSATDVGTTSIHSNMKDAYCRKSPSVSGKFLLNRPGISVLKNKANLLSFVSHEVVFGSAGPLVSDDAYECSCVAGDAACAYYLELTRPQVVAASDSRYQMYDCPGRSTTKAPENFAVNAGDVGKTSNFLDLHNKGSGRTLLYPTQFAKLLDGPCKQPVAQSYNSCAQYAYRHSSPSAVKKTNGANRCESVPAECRNPQDWLGSL